MPPEEYSNLTDMQLSLTMLPPDTDEYRTSCLSKASIEDIQESIEFVKKYMPGEKYRIIVLEHEIERRTSL